MATVGPIMLGLSVATLPTDATPFVGGGAGAGICIMGEQEALLILVVLHVQHGHLYSAHLPIYEAGGLEQSVRGVVRVREEKGKSRRGLG